MISLLSDLSIERSLAVSTPSAARQRRASPAVADLDQVRAGRGGREQVDQAAVLLACRSGQLGPIDARAAVDGAGPRLAGLNAGRAPLANILGGVEPELPHGGRGWVLGV